MHGAVGAGSRAQSADPVEVTEVVDQLQQVITTLRAKAAMRIEKLCYCRPPAKPARYGVYQPLAVWPRLPHRRIG